MQLGIHSGDVLGKPQDLVVLAVYEKSWARGPDVAKIDRALNGALKAAAKAKDFSGKAKQELVIDTLGTIRCKQVALLGMGKSSDCGMVDWLKLGGRAARLGNRCGAGRLLLVLPDASPVTKEARLESVAKGALLGTYEFKKFRTTDKKRKPTLSHLGIRFESEKLGAAPAKRLLERASVIAEGVVIARDLVNEPASELYPESFAQRVVALAKRDHLRSRILKENELRKLGLRLLLAVGQGSDRPPRLAQLSYVPPGASREKPVFLVGKGITFDSGGLSLKSNANMLDMKVDMAGAAAVVGAMHVVAKLRPRTPVHGVLALAENMPSGKALKLGDVIRSGSGKTVEITNTDAEGRLVLADALHYVGGQRPGGIIDLATLTGAMVVALGPTTTGYFANRDLLATALQEAADRAGEPYWRMPLVDELRSGLDSPIADLKNTGSREGGAITAALFLKEFVGDVPWAHLDIAGPATSERENGHLSKGATGTAVMTLAQYLMPA